MNFLSLLRSQTTSDEIRNLEDISLAVFAILSLLIVGASLVLAIVIEKDMIITPCVMAGLIGSATAALLSALQRRASGWELEDGSKVPVVKEKDSEASKERFNLRMAPYFLFRPFLGIIAGLIVYYGSDFLFTPAKPNDGFDLETWIFFSLLAGLFAKTLIEILKGMFKAVFGRG